MKKVYFKRIIGVPPKAGLKAKQKPSRYGGVEVYYLFISARPYQWIKNLIIFAALIFSKNLFNLTDIYRVMIALVIFCFLSSTVYLINDVIDITADKKHPEKR